MRVSKVEVKNKIEYSKSIIKQGFYSFMKGTIKYKKGVMLILNKVVFC